MKMRVLSACAFGVLATAGMTARALAMPLGDGNFNAALEANPPTAPAFQAGEVDFTAIVALNNCSGSLVRFTTSKPEDMAMVLSNGHCFEGGFLDPGEVLINRDSTRSFRLLSSDGTRSLGTLRAAKVLYATMTDTDVTLYQLGVSFASIKTQYGVDALTIASERPAAGAPIRVVSGYWKKIYSCSVANFVFELHEGDWIFKDSIKYLQPGCETIGGTSGSPIVQADTKMVVGINNTGNENGEHCTVNNPCEVDADGHVNVEEGASYGQELYHFYNCLDAANGIDLSIAGCDLPKPQSFP